MNAVGYIRVSTEEQVSGGVSLEAQTAQLRRYCELRDLNLIEIIADPGVSGGKPLSGRPGGERLLGFAADAVVAWKLDRLFRDAADCLQQTRRWDRRGVALHLIDLGGQAVDTTSPMGRFFLTVMAGAAELERNQIRERTRTAMQHLKAQGRRVGGIPYGYRADDDGFLEPDPEEQSIINRVTAWRGGGVSLRGIVRQLTEGGYRPRGAKWHLTTIERIARAV